MQEEADPENSESAPSYSAASGTRTRTTISGQGILSPSCLPFHHRGSLFLIVGFLKTAAKVLLFLGISKFFSTFSRVLYIQNTLFLIIGHSLVLFQGLTFVAIFYSAILAVDVIDPFALIAF